MGKLIVVVGMMMMMRSTVAFFANPIMTTSDNRKRSRWSQKDDIDWATVRRGLDEAFDKSKELKREISKESRETELDLLRQLGAARSDEELQEVMSELWQVWFSEFGLRNLERIQEVDRLIGAGRAFWPRAERKARALAESYPDWAEPRNRLATVLFLMGRYDEAVTLCEEVLRMKPHHFGCLSGIVMCHIQRGDATSARKWADKRLPQDSGRRSEWCTRTRQDYVLTLMHSAHNSPDLRNP